MEPVKKKPLLPVIKFPVVTKDCIQSGIQPVVGLITIQDNVISEAIVTPAKQPLPSIPSIIV